MNIRIGVSCGRKMSQRAALNHLDIGYTKSLLKSGALPLVLPVLENPSLVERVLDQVDALLLSGGNDINPLLYGEHLMDASYQYCQKRDSNDLLYYRAARERGMPILGICRGLQLINVAEGGSLFQDIQKQVDTKILHSNSGPFDVEHQIAIERESELYRAIGLEELIVNSVHHQAIHSLGKNLRVSAVAPDGVIEGIEGVDGGWLMGVQFHPERLYEKAPFLAIFQYFVSVAGRKA